MLDHPRLIIHHIQQTAKSVAYYALPDFVRSTALRQVLRTGLVASIAISEYRIRPSAPVEDSEVKDAICDTFVQDHSLSACSAASCAHDSATDCEHGKMPFANAFIAGTEKPLVRAAIVGTLAAGTIGAIVALEKGIFNRGERKRATGDRFAHTKQGLVLGAVTGALSVALDYFDPLTGGKTAGDA